MIFSSNLFLFLFLPFALASFCVVKADLRNTWLLIISMLFYAWGSGRLLFWLATVILLNFWFAKAIVHDDYRQAKAFLRIGIIFNVAVLFYFKYFHFFYTQLLTFIPSLKSAMPALGKTGHPLGVSFFTFVAISYLVEVFQRKQTPSTNIIDFGLFMALFPKLLSGPIVRYSEISKSLHRRNIDTDILFEGIWRFSIGLGKKAIIANNLGTVADSIFSLPGGELTTSISWLGIICYTFQIYFDFSGYTDMAIGLGNMFGFRFPENFAQPYRSRSFTEFWRRWHITLSFWLRDFLYIPLGGNRKGEFKTYVNIFIVFSLCGLWHGAALTFIFWGVYHAIVLIVERCLNRFLKIDFTHYYNFLITFILIMVGWVFFRSRTIGEAFQYLRAMFGFTEPSSTFQFFHLRYYLQKDVVFFLAMAVFFSFFPVEKITGAKRLDAIISPNLMTLFKGIVCIPVLIYSFAVISKTSFRPFIYFNF